jgi:hypothetical protein
VGLIQILEYMMWVLILPDPLEMISTPERKKLMWGLLAHHSSSQISEASVVYIGV